MGVRERSSSPEIDYDKVDRVRGLDITITLLRNLTKKAVLCWLPLTSVHVGRVAKWPKQSMKAREVKRVALADKPPRNALN